MNNINTMYYCTYTKNSGAFPRRSLFFATEEGARAHAEQLIKQGYWGVISRHCERSRDDDNDCIWWVDGKGAQAREIEMLGYF